MPAGVLPVQRPALTGAQLVFAAATAVDGDEFANTGSVMLAIRNGGAVDTQVTVSSLQKCSQGFDHDVVVTVPAGQTFMVGPFFKFRFNNATGNVLAVCNPAASVELAAIECGAL